MPALGIKKAIPWKNCTDYEEAVKCYEKAVQFKPNDPEIWNNRGNAMTYLHRHPETISYYDKAIQLKPDYLSSLE
ncbi:tetratricopeptide repeat protein [Microcoleus sp. FACHB-672]|uniref:tetratricopeptide repeat protein n=1 Tax=Microcoleus sp. FACHB-672 TaxID=2692825 RepID=UPI001688966F|nr:tetratricopeptide repeat protein [Microcoleus sp. FACHB-672]MBD2040120.1 tetratricopeptide repeat protein [Microcoleus sp. FACHB-672]